MTTIETTRIAICPNGCELDTGTPFVYPTCCIDYEELEMGVLAHVDTSLSNRWEDGTTGIPDDVVEAVHVDMCMPVCVECGVEVEWEDMQ